MKIDVQEIRERPSRFRVTRVHRWTLSHNGAKLAVIYNGNVAVRDAVVKALRTLRSPGDETAEDYATEFREKIAAHISEGKATIAVEANLECDGLVLAIVELTSARVLDTILDTLDSLPLTPLTA